MSAVAACVDARLGSGDEGVVRNVFGVVVLRQKRLTVAGVQLQTRFVVVLISVVLLSNLLCGNLMLAVGPVAYVLLVD